MHQPDNSVTEAYSFSADDSEYCLSLSAILHSFPYVPLFTCGRIMPLFDPNSFNRGCKNFLMVLILLYWLYNILSNPFIQQLIRQDEFSVLVVPAIVIGAAYIVFFLDTYGLYLPLAVAMMYEIVVAAVKLTMAILCIYKPNLNFDPSDTELAMLFFIFDGCYTEIRKTPIEVIAREACLFFFCFLSLLVAVFQISEIARKERKRLERQADQILQKHRRILADFDDEQGLSSTALSPVSDSKAICNEDLCRLPPELSTADDTSSPSDSALDGDGSPPPSLSPTPSSSCLSLPHSTANSAVIDDGPVIQVATDRQSSHREMLIPTVPMTIKHKNIRLRSRNQIVMVRVRNRLGNKNRYRSKIMNKFITFINYELKTKNYRLKFIHCKNGGKTAGKEMESVGQMEIEEDRFGVDDYLSRLPDLCLRKICSNLTRQDIFNLSLVNSRMKKIGHERSVDHIKWSGGSLKLSQTEDGYAFFIVYDNGRRRRACEECSYQYEIVKDGDEFKETKMMNLVEPEFDSITVGAPHTWPVPQQFYDRLFNLMRHVEVEFFRPSWMLLDTQFYKKFERALNGRFMEHFFALDIREQNITHEARMCLARIFKGVHELNLIDSGNLINEEFLREVAGSKLRRLAMEFDGRDNNQKLANFFRPPESILPCLTTFAFLSVSILELNANWVVQLCMLYFDVNTSFDKARINFSVDRSLTDDMFSTVLRTNEFEYEWDEDDGTGYITRTADGSSVQIEYYDDYEVEGTEIKEVLLIFVK